MQFSMQREILLKPLQMVAGAVERRHTLPILANVLLELRDNQLSMLATDLEVELTGFIDLENPVGNTAIAVPARKLMDICRALPEQAQLNITHDQQKLTIKSGRSRFTLSTLPGTDFPRVVHTDNLLSFSLPQNDLRYLLTHSQFAMAQQDVRYYLNGLLLELNRKYVRTVATNGHRLAVSSLPANLDITLLQIIVPRKGVTELLRLLSDTADEVRINVNNQYISVYNNEFTFTSKLIDGRFPDYDRVLPQPGKREVILERDELRQALTRAAILSSEEFRGVGLKLSKNLLRVSANNPEQEQAEEELVVDYNNGDLEVGFNVSYLLDALNVMPAGTVSLMFADDNNSLLLQSQNDTNSRYLVMPMLL